MPKVSIYQGEGVVQTLVRNRAIQAATAKKSAGIFDGEKVGIASEITSYSCAITEHPIMGVAL